MTVSSDTRGNPPREKRSAKDDGPPHPSVRPRWSAASASAVLAGIDEKHRKVIAAAYRRRGGQWTTWVHEDWVALEAAIFETENQREHRGAARGCSDVEPVLGMRKRRVALEALVDEGVHEGRAMLVVSDRPAYAHLQRSRP